MQKKSLFLAIIFLNCLIGWKINLHAEPKQPIIPQVNVNGDFNDLNQKISIALKQPINFANLASEALYDIGMNPSQCYLSSHGVAPNNCAGSGRILLTTGEMIYAIMIDPKKLYAEYFENTQSWSYGVCRFMLHHESCHVLQYFTNTHTNVLTQSALDLALNSIVVHEHVNKKTAKILHCMFCERSADATAAKTCKCWQCCRDWAHYWCMLPASGGKLNDATAVFPQGINNPKFLSLFGNSTTLEAAEKWVTDHRHNIVVSNLQKKFEIESVRLSVDYGATHPTNTERAINTFITSAQLKKNNFNALCIYHRWRQTQGKNGKKAA